MKPSKLCVDYQEFRMYYFNCTLSIGRTPSFPDLSHSTLHCLSPNWNHEKKMLGKWKGKTEKEGLGGRGTPWCFWHERLKTSPKTSPKRKGIINGNTIWTALDRPGVGGHACRGRFSSPCLSMQWTRGITRNLSFSGKENYFIQRIHSPHKFQNAGNAQ